MTYNQIEELELKYIKKIIEQIEYELEKKLGLNLK